MTNKEPAYNTFRQYDDQISKDHVNKTRTEPTMLVEMPDGTINVGKSDSQTSSIYGTEADERWDVYGGQENLSDQRQAELAEILAGKPLRQAVGAEALAAASVSMGEDPWKPAVNKVELDYDEKGMIKMPNWEEAASQDAEEPRDKALNPDLALAQRGLKDAKEERQRAQNEGRGEDSTYWYQRINEYIAEIKDIEGRQ